MGQEPINKPALIRTHGNPPTLSTIPEYTVAFLDILGFKEKIENMELEVLAAKYQLLISHADAMNRPLLQRPDLPSLFPSHAVGSPYCQRFVFSDSIILISHDDSLVASTMVLVYCWRLMQLMLAAGFLPRGAISFGKMYVNPQQNVFLGTALTEAAKLEQKQEWTGACLHPSVLEKFSELKSLEPLIKPYSVPMKGGKTQKLHTINWRLNMRVMRGTQSLFNPVVNIKNANALDYARYVVEEGAYLNDTISPIELRGFYVGDKKPPFGHGDEY